SQSGSSPVGSALVATAGSLLFRFPLLRGVFGHPRRGRSRAQRRPGPIRNERQLPIRSGQEPRRGWGGGWGAGRRSRGHRIHRLVAVGSRLYRQPTLWAASGHHSVARRWEARMDGRRTVLGIRCRCDQLRPRRSGASAPAKRKRTGRRAGRRLREALPVLAWLVSDRRRSGALQGSAPLEQMARARFRRNLGFKRTPDLPGSADLLLAFPNTCTQAAEKRRPKRSGLKVLRSNDLSAEEIRLELHQNVIGRRTAVHFEDENVPARVLG